MVKRKGMKNVRVGKKKDDVVTGTGPKYLRYLRLGGRPGRITPRTFTEPLPRLQRAIRSSLGESVVPKERVMELQEEMAIIREQLQKLQATQ